VQQFGLRLGAATTNLINCGAFPQITIPAAGTWACWWLSTSQGSVAQRLMAKTSGAGPTMYMTHANAANNRVDFEIPRQSTILRALTEAANFKANWTTRLGEPFFLAATYDTSSGLPKLYMGSLTLPPAEPSSYITQQLGTGTVNDTSANNFVIGNLAAGGVPLVGTMLWNFVSIAELTLAEIIRLWNVMALNIVPRDFRGYVSSWRPGTNGTGLVIDESGRGNHGTISGATLARNMTDLGRLGLCYRNLRFEGFRASKRFLLIPA